MEIGTIFSASSIPDANPKNSFAYKRKFLALFTIFFPQLCLLWLSWEHFESISYKYEEGLFE